ncbi:MAG: hypothetical protein EOS79_29000 [Mesorhizobium sp.]|nr:MAG: hypothetical protein EOS79_29000 [Mesorhizobium sp.]
MAGTSCQPGQGNDPQWGQPAMVADITFLHLAEEFAFLGAVLGAFSRRSLDGRWTCISEQALRSRLSKRPSLTASPNQEASFHHRPRSSIRCGAYSELLHLHGLQASMSRVGNAYDNAKAESFMKTLKQEEVQGLAYKQADDARRRIGAFIETVYNTQRGHST